MTAARRILAGAVMAVLAVSTGVPVRGFAIFGSAWPPGTLPVHLQLGSGSGTLVDGSTSWNQAFTSAIDVWNAHLDLLKFSAVQDSTVPREDGDDVNQVFFDSRYYGRAFPADTLAITTRWELVDTSVRTEGDIVFNTAFTFDSYRGPVRSSGGRERWDIRRVALHELGHLLGLDHPDEKGQSVSALMNHLLGDLDALTADDIAGARSLYSASVTSNVSFPPRNEPNDFYAQLIVIYRDLLRAAAVTTYVDPEGVVVWLSEYARYRVGLCDHGTATIRVFSQIDNTGVYGVCALTPAGPIPFPPRDEGLDFMNGLDVKYHDGLGRSAMTSFVNNEGAVVWVLEYFRYRLNGCGHGDATAKVLAQVRGEGIQPVCL